VSELAPARILIADDEPANVRLLERLLSQAGYANVRTTTDSRDVRRLYEEFQPDLILLDLMMPHLDGVAVMQQLPVPAGEYVPILILTADVTPQAKERALSAGAKDFLTKPFDRTEVLLRIKNLLDTRVLYRELERHNRSLEELVAERTQRLLQSEKVATMGSLLAGVAHELNNPLAIVMGQALLLKEAAADGPLAARAAKIGAAAERAARIVRNFLSLARQRPTERAAVQLNLVIQEALELLAYELRADNVEVVQNLADGLPPLWADAHQLHQVLVNLVTNAHHAMRHSQPPRRVTVTTAVDPGGARLQLTIADTGPGIPSDIRDKIFEPFFTTKPTGEGTGLGLSLSRGIIEDHGGTISIESAPGHGATFKIQLPLSDRARTATAHRAVESLPPVARKRVLVVDDEPEIAALLVEIVAAAGHDVDVADNGAAALEYVTRHQYDLVLTDTKMPELDGVGLYREVERRVPALCGRMVFLTGDVLDSTKREFLEATGAPFLMKPFDVTEVRRLVHRMLAGATPRSGNPTTT
jgi:two-component system NtrC family sensor kinase